MTSKLHRRALLRWLAATGLSLPMLANIALSDEPDAQTLALQEFVNIILQRMFPHPALENSVYQDVAIVMTGAIQAQPGLNGLIDAGRATLDQAGDDAWPELDAAAQIAALEDNQSAAFFLALRGLGGFLFYNTPAVWELLGYQGPSFEKGGYLARGFDDIDWLEEARDGR